jgi:predicted nucleic acid-binding protein
MARGRTLVDAVRAAGHEAFVADTPPLVYRIQRRSAPSLTAACDPLFDAVERGELACLVSGVSAAELLVAPVRAGRREIALIDSFLHQPFLGIVAVGEAVARRGAHVLAGRRIRRLADALIAATALEAGVPLVTNDRRLAWSGVVETYLVADFTA